MPQPTTITKNAKKVRRGISSGMMVANPEMRPIDVDLGNGDTLIVIARDMSVGNIRKFVGATKTGDMDVIVTEFMKIASDWKTYDDDGNVVPIPDTETGEPWAFTEENIDKLGLPVFERIAEALGK